MTHEPAIILGAGISGIAAGYKLENTLPIFEARDRYGGLCDNFTIEGFRFDYAIHLSFTENPIVKVVFGSVPYIAHYPDAKNYCEGSWAKHPIQNNSYGFPIDERIRIIKSFMNRSIEPSIKNYRDWLRFSYGDYFSETYPERYTRKYWCCESTELSTNWIGNRMYRPSIEEVLFGAMTDETPNTYYANEMRYPAKGGYRAFFEHLAENQDIRLNHRLTWFDPVNKEMRFENGEEFSYDAIISSLPLPEIIKAIPNCPERVVNAAKKLNWTSVCLVSIGFRKELPFPSLWFYVYDESIPFARAYSPGMKSGDNVPQGKSSLQCEIYYTPNKPLGFEDNALIDKVLSSLEVMNLAHVSDVELVDVRHVKYANVIFSHDMERNRKTVHEYLDEHGVINIGRFGRWDYLWSDQSFMTGFNVVL